MTLKFSASTNENQRETSTKLDQLNLSLVFICVRIVQGTFASDQTGFQQKRLGKRKISPKGLSVKSVTIPFPMKTPQRPLPWNPRKNPRLNLTAAICPAVRKYCALSTLPSSHLLRRLIIISLELTAHGSFKVREGLAQCNCIIIIFYFFSTDWSLVLEKRFLRSRSWSCSERMCQRSRARRRTLLSSLCQRPFRCGACLLGRLRSRCGRADFKVPNPIFGGPRCGRNRADWFEIFAAKPGRERTMSERSKRYQDLTHHDVKHCAIVCSILFPSWKSSSFLGLIDT